MTEAHTRLSRAAVAARGRALPGPPPRIVHVGLGAFHRAHQAWYTAHAADAGAWGILGFAGRNGDTPRRLAPQDGLYTLVERGPEGDRFEIVGSVAAVGDPRHPEGLVSALADPAICVVTLTITEAGYAPNPDDSSVFVRIAEGLDARRRLGGPPIAIVPCDNLPDNGEHARAALKTSADGSSALEAWIGENVSFVTTVVDRITPSTTDADLRVVEAAIGMTDLAPVVTEPHSEWILAGEFPSGRPDWESAGATVVSDAAPYAARKLWMLNGAHTLLAAVGLTRGHRTVAQAFADPLCASAVAQWWDEAERHLPFSVGRADYRDTLPARFANPRIEHALEKIAQNAVLKLQTRIVPVALAELAAGRTPIGAATAFSGWLASAHGDVPPGSERWTLLIADVSPPLASSERFVAATREAAALITGATHADRTR